MSFNFFTRVLKGTAIYVLSIAPIVLTVDHAVVSMATVQGKSMAPTLNAGPTGPNLQSAPSSPNSRSIGIRTTAADYADTGEIIVVRKLLYEPKRGDVVVIDSPGKPGEQAVKRLVAMEGDVIAYLSPIRKKSITSLSREMERKRLEDERRREQEEVEEMFGRRMQEGGDVQVLMEEINEYFKNRRERESARITDITPAKPIHVTNDTTTTTENSFPTSSPLDTLQTTPENTSTQQSEKKQKSNILFEDVELQIVRIPTGSCWVEGDNPEVSRDSKEYGPIPLGMVRGKVEAVVWPTNLAGFIRPHTGTTQILYTHHVRGPPSNW